MSAPTVHLLCPGQGAQHVGMGADYHKASRVARETFDEANALLGFDLAKLCFDGPDDELARTEFSQPAIFVTSVAAFRHARDAGLIPADFAAVDGLSLGEYTALHLAGCFDFETGVRLVAARGKLMQLAAEASASGMVALVGAEASQAEQLCADAAQGEVLAPANYNAPGQIVCSGTTAACGRLVDLAGQLGVRAVALAVAGAFHSPLMQPAADGMAAQLADAELKTPRVPVTSNVTAEPHRIPESIRELLVEQIVRPVRWQQTMELVANDPDRAFVELPPGKVLTGLLRKLNRRATITTLHTLPA